MCIRDRYESSNHTTKTSFGKVYLDAGMQYEIDLQKNRFLRLGAYGNLKNTLNGQQDIIRETIIRSPDNGDVRVDSVFVQNGVKGKIIYPATLGLGFTIGNKPNFQKNLYGTWLV